MNESCAAGGIHRRRVRTASGSDRILRATQDKSLFVSYCLIRSLPLAVLTRFMAILTFTPEMAMRLSVAFDTTLLTETRIQL